MGLASTDLHQRQRAIDIAGEKLAIKNKNRQLLRLLRVVAKDLNVDTSFLSSMLSMTDGRAANSLKRYVKGK